MSSYEQDPPDPADPVAPAAPPAQHDPPPDDTATAGRPRRTSTNRAAATEAGADGAPRVRRRPATDADGDPRPRRAATSADGEPAARRAPADPDGPARPRRRPAAGDAGGRASERGADGQDGGEHRTTKAGERAMQRRAHRVATGRDPDRPRRPTPRDRATDRATDGTTPRDRAETSRTESGRAESGRTEAGRNETGRTGANGAEPSRAPSPRRPGEDDRYPGPRRPNAARSRRTPPSRGRILARRWGAIGVVLGVAGLVVVLLFTPVLGVSQVEVSGLQGLTADQVRTTADVTLGTPMLRLPTEQIAARVRTLPRVASVDVYRDWPNTVVIAVTERTPVGVLKMPDGSHLIDATGDDYATVPTAPAGLPVIQLPSASPHDARTQAVVAVLAALPAALLPQVVNIGAQTPGSVQFALANGKSVMWGSADQSARKSAVLAALLSQPGRIYDVSSPDLPTIQS